MARYRLTESRLRNMIREAVENILNVNNGVNGKELIIDIFQNCKWLSELETYYSFAKKVLYNDEAEKGKINPQFTNCLIVPFGDKLYQVYEIGVKGKDNVSVYLASLTSYVDSNGKKYYQIESEFSIDEREISLEKFQSMFPAEYDKLIHRFESMAQHIFH